ncbi:MAG: 2TM domain-containing protein [Pseudomonadota bacterium]|nr:2TM domain-containing protein [Pseudomonadota bacterium]
MRDETEGTNNKFERGSRRLRWFCIHLLVYFAAITALVIINILFSAAEPWFIFPMVVWGAPLAVHVAFVIGLLDTLLGLK